MTAEFLHDRRRADGRTTRFVNPFRHIARELETMVGDFVARGALPPGARVLDYGCADQPYRHLLPPGCDYVGADLRGNPLADVEIAPDGAVPVDDGSFDLVLSTQVLEHVEHPNRYLAECWRVLRPGGSLVLSTHGLMVAHGDPIDRWRWTGSGLRHLVGEAGFDVVEFRGLMGLGAAALQLFQFAVTRRLPPRAVRVVSGGMQSAIAAIDRRTPREARTEDALVLALLAQRPEVPPFVPWIDRVIDAFGEAYPSASFVQVGANDGVQRDPIREQILRRRWHGLMVEPVPYVFERLVRNYAAIDRVEPVNVAVADRDGTAELHHLPESDDPELWHWYHALGSFRRDVVLRHRDLVPDVDERVVSTEVPCLTFDTLCARHGIRTLDVVQIDVEGYDYEVLRQVDLDRLAPLLVMYEHHHLSPEERADARALLQRAGFEAFAEGLDTVALHVGRVSPGHERLLAVWREAVEACGE